MCVHVFMNKCECATTAQDRCHSDEVGGQFFLLMIPVYHHICLWCLCVCVCVCIVVCPTSFQSVRVHFFTDVSHHRHITCCLTRMGTVSFPFPINLLSVGTPPLQGVATATSLQGVFLMVCGTE